LIRTKQNKNRKPKP